MWEKEFFSLCSLKWLTTIREIFFLNGEQGSMRGRKNKRWWAPEISQDRKKWLTEIIWCRSFRRLVFWYSAWNQHQREVALVTDFFFFAFPTKVTNNYLALNLWITVVSILFHSNQMSFSLSLSFCANIATLLNGVVLNVLSVWCRANVWKKKSWCLTFTALCELGPFLYQQSSLWEQIRDLGNLPKLFQGK